MITPTELESIICGKEVIDFKDLQANSHYEGGYTKDTPVVKYNINLIQKLMENTS